MGKPTSTTGSLSVLLVGSGGREHALAWKMRQSPRLGELFICPGNAGTESLGANLPVPVEDVFSIRQIALEKKLDLVVVGPEVPLSLGMADALQEVGISVFGPTQAASRIETSKAFAKEFMQRHRIPTPSSGIFTSLEDAQSYLEKISGSVVIKASGLAAGKGVYLPTSLAEGRQVLKDLLIGQILGEAGQTVIIEERLEGEEISLLAFTDGNILRLLPPAQDHKRLYENERGPNTGGMGAYAPAPACPPTLAGQLAKSILQPVVDGLRQEGTPFCGVLYAGLMLTSTGPRVLEYNCRLGDPETQALLPLLETDILEIILACVDGGLAELDVHWNAGAAASIVLAAENYPLRSTTSRPISGLDCQSDQWIVFHCGTKREGEQVLSAGGRVLAVTAWGKDLPAVLKSAYQGVQAIHFEGMQYRRDIGSQGLQRLASQLPAYTSAGVNLDAGVRTIDLIDAAVRSTYTPAVLAGVGSFGGLLDASLLQGMHHPVLVASTDGVGTKTMLAAQVGRYKSLGYDLVNHCINDILVQGAHPLFFLDYFAASRLDPAIVAEIVTGIAGACREAGCALIGGETAEMPGVYWPGEFDIAGTIVGVVERDAILPRPELQPGDRLLGLRSTGPHTNGFSLIRRIFEGYPLDVAPEGWDEPLGAVLLAPHRSYLPLLDSLLKDPARPVKALAHITGGGLVDNIPRVLPPALSACIHRGTWPVPPLYTLIQKLGDVTPDEMARVFNLGIGMVGIVAENDVQKVLHSIPEETWVIGELVPGDRQVILAD